MPRIKTKRQARNIRELMHEGEVFHFLGVSPEWVWNEVPYSDWEFKAVKAGHKRAHKRDGDFW